MEDLSLLFAINAWGSIMLLDFMGDWLDQITIKM